MSLTPTTMKNRSTKMLKINLNNLNKNLPFKQSLLVVILSVNSIFTQAVANEITQLEKPNELPVIIVTPESKPIKGNDHYDEHQQQVSNQAIEEVTVTSTATNRSLDDIAQPITVITANDLANMSGDTLGALLANTPGVANASFGQGVGRPVLRGLSGKRVKVMQNGTDASDLSAMSSDHGSMIDPVNAEQIEIIQGPSTLLYGGGAIGGVVNVVKQQIHTEAYTGFNGKLSSRVSSADSGKQVTAVMNAGFDNIVLHLEAFSRESEDYAVGDNQYFGDKALNSDVEGVGGNIALSWIIEDAGYVGFSVSNLNYDYAVPNTANEPARVTPEQMRYELVGAWFDPFQHIHEWKTELAITEYKHKEEEGALVEGLFEQSSIEFKTLMTHHPVYLNGNEFNGSFGLHLTQADLSVCHGHQGCSAIPDFSDRPWNGSQGSNLISLEGYLFSHDTPMPQTTSSNLGFFWLEETPWKLGVMEFGLRYDRSLIEADYETIRPDYRHKKSYYDNKVFDLYAVNWAATWVIDDSHKLGLSLARAERAPDAQELYWNSEHHATFSYQLDNAKLDKETANTVNLNWVHSISAVETSLTAFYYLFDGYIYNAMQDFVDPYHGEVVYRHKQAGAYFTGLEFQLHWDLNQHDAGFSVDVFADTVTARLNEGANKNLPRTPPASLGTALNWKKGYWLSSFDVRAFAKQNKVAENETPTDGYYTANIVLAYEMPLAQGQSVWIRLKGMNLTDEFALNHVSYLKREVPIVGRNAVFELAYKF